MTYATRSGRQIKKPDRYEPKEICDDDYDDSDFSDTEDEENIFSTDEESASDEEDADDNGNLKGFVVSDSDEEDDA
tara:strand:- start:3737 stop:3964 length:228 start_codon:yes stop_codon:yes gene_type:complete